jgi:hypothetical protein
MRVVSNKQILSQIRLASIHHSTRNRFFSMNQHSDTAEALLNDGIYYSQNWDFNKAHDCFMQVIQNKVAGGNSGVLDKAIAYLYLAKDQMECTSSMEWQGIQNLKTSKALFLKLKTSNQTDSERYKKYEKEMKAVCNKIIFYYGSIEEYEKGLEKHLRSFSDGFFEEAKEHQDKLLSEETFLNESIDAELVESQIQNKH